MAALETLSERRARKWAKYQDKLAASTFGSPAPVDKDERAERERRVHDRYLEKCEAR